MEMSQFKIMPIISCFIRLTGLFLFIMVVVTIQPSLKMYSWQPNGPPLLESYCN